MWNVVIPYSFLHAIHFHEIYFISNLCWQHCNIATFLPQSYNFLEAVLLLNHAYCRYRISMILIYTTATLLKIHEVFFFDKIGLCMESLLISDLSLFSRTTLGLSLATWVLPASHQQMVLTLMPPCSSPLLFFSPHSSLVISWQQPLHHRHRRRRHLLPYRLGSQSLLRAILPLVILCSSSRGIFSSPLHRYIAFSSSNFNFARRDLVRTCDQNLSAIFPFGDSKMHPRQPHDR